jgi:hypothetical protein
MRSITAHFRTIHVHEDACSGERKNATEARCRDGDLNIAGEKWLQSRLVCCAVIASDKPDILRGSEWCFAERVSTRCPKRLSGAREAGGK